MQLIHKLAICMALYPNLILELRCTAVGNLSMALYNICTMGTYTQVCIESRYTDLKGGGHGEKNFFLNS